MYQWLTDLAGHVDDGLCDTAQGLKACDIVDEGWVAGNAGNLVRVDFFTNTFEPTGLYDTKRIGGRLSRSYIQHYLACCDKTHMC